jgi:hypothetical protein
MRNKQKKGFSTSFFIIVFWQDSDYLILEVNEADGVNQEPIAATKLQLPDMYLRARPNQPDIRDVRLDGGGSMKLALTFVPEAARVESQARSKSSNVSAQATPSVASVRNSFGSSISISSLPTQHKGPKVESKQFTGSAKAVAVVNSSPQLKDTEFEFEGSLGPNEVEIKVQACGLGMLDYQVAKNIWKNTPYPFVPGI